MDSNVVNDPVLKINYVCEQCYFITKSNKEMLEHASKCNLKKQVNYEEYMKLMVELSECKTVINNFKLKEVEYKNKIYLLTRLLQDNTTININSLSEMFSNNDDTTIKINYSESSDVNTQVFNKDNGSNLQCTAVESKILKQTNIDIPVKTVNNQSTSVTKLEETLGNKSDDKSGDKSGNKSADNPDDKSDNKSDNKSEQEKSEESLENKSDELNVDNNQRKTIFRVVKGIEIRNENTEEEFNEIIQNVIDKETSDSSIAELYNITEQECKDRITHLLETVKTSRQYSGELKQLAYTRLKLFKFLNLSEYKDFLDNNIKIIKDILSTRMDKKKISGIVKNKVLLPIELRLFDYNGYETILIDTSEISLFKKYLRYKYGFNRTYQSFNKNNIISLYESYNVALFNIIDYARVIIPNKFKLNNIIYVKVPKHCEEDPFSFYYYDSVKDNVRNWKMDCRLEDLTNDISSVILEYCISLYRKIYYKVYHDNHYRKEHEEQIFEYEGEQLIQNIMLLSNLYAFNKRMRDFIIEKCTYVPTKNDKFNLYCDDIINRKRFNILKKEYSQNPEENIKKIINRLFDNISQEEIDQFYLEKQNY